MSCTSVWRASKTGSIWHLIRRWFKYRDMSAWRRKSDTFCQVDDIFFEADLSFELSHHRLDLWNAALCICVSLQSVFYLYQCLIRSGRLLPHVPALTSSTQLVCLVTKNPTHVSVSVPSETGTYKHQTYPVKICRTNYEQCQMTLMSDEDKMLLISLKITH